MGPLEGIRVLDLTQAIAGPYATKLLSDHGADVVKIEHPGRGDVSRRMGPFPGDIPHRDRSGMFLELNTSKRSVTLNLKSATGRDILGRLAEQADLVIEGFRPGAIERLGLGAARLEELNPRAALVSVSSFGAGWPVPGLRGRRHACLRDGWGAVDHGRVGTRAAQDRDLRALLPRRRRGGGVHARCAARLADLGRRRAGRHLAARHPRHLDGSRGHEPRVVRVLRVAVLPAAGVGAFDRVADGRVPRHRRLRARPLRAALVGPLLQHDRPPRPHRGRAPRAEPPQHRVRPGDRRGVLPVAAGAHQAAGDGGRGRRRASR